MIIALPAEETKMLCPHFGHAPLFAIVKVDENKQITDISYQTPTVSGHSALPSWLKSFGVEVIIVGGIGKPALANLAANGIRPIAGAPVKNVGEIVSLWLTEKLELKPTECSHHHGQHDHHDHNSNCHEHHGHHNHEHQGGCCH